MLRTLVILLAVVAVAEASSPANVAYRRIDVQDAITGEAFPVALWYPTRAVPAPVFLSASLSACRLPTALCRLVAFEMQVAADAPPAEGAHGPQRGAVHRRRAGEGGRAGPSLRGRLRSRSTAAAPGK